MMDLKAPDKVFKSSAFEPSEADKQNYKHKQRSPEKGRSGYKSEAFVKEVPDLLISDSDDDLPDVAHMLASRKGKGKRQAQVVSSDADSDVRIVRLRIFASCTNFTSRFRSWT